MQYFNETLLLFTLRTILGVLFFFQGYDKVFRLGISGVITYFRQESQHRRIPGAIIVTSAWFTSFVELTCGFLLVAGLFRAWALYLLTVDLILVTVAFSFLKPMWDMQLLFPRLVMLSALLWFGTVHDIIALDTLVAGWR
jgi:putative oxidoreductase